MTCVLPMGLVNEIVRRPRSPGAMVLSRLEGGGELRRWVGTPWSSWFVSARELEGAPVLIEGTLGGDGCGIARLTGMLPGGGV